MRGVSFDSVPHPGRSRTLSQLSSILRLKIAQTACFSMVLGRKGLRTPHSEPYTPDASDGFPCFCCLLPDNAKAGHRALGSFWRTPASQSHSTGGCPKPQTLQNQTLPISVNKLEPRLFSSAQNRYLMSILKYRKLAAGVCALFAELSQMIDS